MIAPQAAADWSEWFAGRVSRMHASEIRELLKLLERPDVVSFGGTVRNTIRLNYSLQSEESIAEGVARLGKLVARVVGKR